MKIVITQKLPFEIEKYLQGFTLDYNKTDRDLTMDELKVKISDADGLICMLSDRIDKSIIDAGQKLKVIANYAVGYNNIDVTYAGQKGIVVCNTPDVLTETTAELAVALLLSVSRRIVEGHKFVEEGKFVGWKPELLLGTDLYKKTVGIFGFGKIGQTIGRILKGFDVKILYHTRHKNFQAELLTGAEYTDFEKLLKESDFIIIAAPLNESTKHKFTINEFKLMKKTAILVNIGRGPIVKENDLYFALKEKIIRGAGLDVFEFEPKIYEGLFELNNVVMLPHIGSASEETRKAMAKLCCDSVIDVLINKNKPIYSVN
ncbi:MAG: glyoxylate reductase [Deferribacteres bacterium]|jgi:lactate dehydrogenase-like 2-hydroxyacid dehydrogenase|nr:D-isomer specific 2-hydroxyacid dehydrogenase, catalytic component [Deferribacteraceae bacterium]MDK2792828.1 glyoxylate reductase [Deferribacteres bacterium]